MTPHQSDTLLSRYLGNTLEEGSIRLIGGIAVLSIVIAAIVYFV